MKPDTLTQEERERLRTRGTIYVRRRGQRVRVDAGDAGVITFDFRFRTLAAALDAALRHAEHLLREEGSV